MPPVVIENPIINSPFEEPSRHYHFDGNGITDTIVPERRKSSYFVPIARPRSRTRAVQMALSTESEWTGDRVEENTFVNRVRARVAIWRGRGYPGITTTTRRLLEHWKHPHRERRLFFCQIEALETAIYLAEAAGKDGQHWIEAELKQANADANPLLFRVAFKLATGSGKTVVMAMIIAWQTLNRLANDRDSRFTDSFLIVTPGITIRDRLRVLLPNDAENYYEKLDLVPPDYRDDLQKARLVITNFHSFMLRERVSAGKLTKSILAQGTGGQSAFTETPDQMVNRVCRELGKKKGILVINDEAHHCYRRRPEADQEKLIGDDRKEAERRSEEARIWISGLEAVQAKLGIKVVYDLSATPFFLRGSGYSKITADGQRVTEGILFPWVVSDFSLIDAIECGVVKVPRVPVVDNAMEGDQPTYRVIYDHVKGALPKKGRGTKDESESGSDPVLPGKLEGAIRALYQNYEKSFRQWEESVAGKNAASTPPVFIVVANNTNVSKLIFDYIAGYEKTLPDGSTVLVPGKLPLFSNVVNGAWTPRPTTILVDSEQLESGEAMSADFKKIAAREIEEFKEDYRRRFPGRNAEDLTDEDLLREVMNTVGKPGKLGEGVRCVVSVSMLTEGWDANTVTHILGMRAFGTQLLCEQVVGRGLRRRSYDAERREVRLNGKTVEFDSFPVEYAEVYGVPFSFIPTPGTEAPPPPPKPTTRVRALESRIACEISFPRVMGYRYDLPAERLTADFGDDAHLALTTHDIPTEVENAPIVGESTVMTLDDLKARREQEVAFLLAKVLLERHFRDDEGNLRPWLFPQLLPITQRWLRECLTCKDNTFPQLLLFVEVALSAAKRIYDAIVKSTPGDRLLKPIMRPYDPVGSTRYVDFDTARPVYPTRPDRCHISHVVADTDTWEQKMAQALEEMDEVVHYVKNHNLGFTIPYTLDGQERQYHPDFITRVRDAYALEHGDGDHGENLLNLIVEVSGQQKRDKVEKVATARNLWVPAVNNHGGFGRWAFIEIGDPWDAKNAIRSALRKG